VAAEFLALAAKKPENPARAPTATSTVSSRRLDATRREAAATANADSGQDFRAGPYGKEP